MAAPKQDRGALLTLKVTLLGTDPPVWRRFEVLDFITLEDIHFILQHVMGWDDDHLHQFFYGKVRYGIPSPSYYDNQMQDEGDFFLSDFFKRKGSKLRYEYDFGDSWLHEIVLESKRPAPSGHTHPVCLNGMRNCPPEDVGGIWGYAEIIEAMSNPQDPRYREVEEWLGGPYDPDHFDLEEVNQILSAMRYSR